jgi:hypothetical protein
MMKPRIKELVLAYKAALDNLSEEVHKPGAYYQGRPEPEVEQADQQASHAARELAEAMLEALDEEPGIPLTVDGCLLCAVRELTEGTPTIWNNPDNIVPGQMIRGVVLRAGTLPSPFHPVEVPFVDLWTGGQDRMRVAGYQGSLARALEMTAPAVGDQLSMVYVGREILPPEHRMSGRPYHRFRTEITRGHH